MSHTIGVRKKSDPKKGVREAADSQKRGPLGKKFGNLWSRTEKVFLTQFQNMVPKHRNQGNDDQKFKKDFKEDVSKQLHEINF